MVPPSSPIVLIINCSTDHNNYLIISYCNGDSTNCVYRLSFVSKGNVVCDQTGFLDTDVALQTQSGKPVSRTDGAV